MSVEQLLFEHYDGIVDTPEAVSKMRDTILDFAVHGRLVEQDPDDEPACELLERISAERIRLTELIESRNMKPVDSTESTQFPHLIPLNWSWTRIAHLGLINPKNKLPDSLEASFTPMRLIASEYSATSQHEKRLWGKIKKGYTHFAEGDVGLAKITPCFENGKSTVFRNLTGGVGSGTTELHVLRPLIVLADYVLIFLKRQKFIETGIQIMTGTAGQKRVPLEYFVYSPFPLPPLAEQHRIVAKVDELMTRCNRLEENFKEREDHRKRFTKASFSSLTKSGIDESEFIKRSGFVVEKFDRLTVDVDQIKNLRQTILDLAVRGKLVQQDRNDEPVEELSNRIERERQKLMGLRSNRKNLVISDDVIEPPFEVPSTWQWERFGNIVDFQAGKTPSRNEPSFWSPGKFSWVTIADMVDGGELISTREKVSELAKLEKFKTDPVPQGTMIMSFKLTIGKITRLGTPAYHNEAIIAITPYLLELDPFIFRFLPMFARQGNKKNAIKGATLNQTSLSNILIPLPPLAEQHRIVTKFDELMQFCNELTEFLLRRSSQTTVFVESTLRRLQNGN